MDSPTTLDTTSGGDGAPAPRFDPQPFDPSSQSGDPDDFLPLGSAPHGVTNGHYDPAAFTALDFYRVDDLLTDDEKAFRQEIRDVVDREVLPVIEQHAQTLTFPLEAARALARAGAVGPTIPVEYGGRGMSSVAYGLAMQEVERGEWLPRLATAEAIGCFALTEPNVGSDPGAMTTRARTDGNEVVITGHKRWSTNASIADVALITGGIVGVAMAGAILMRLTAVGSVSDLIRVGSVTRVKVARN